MDKNLLTDYLQQVVKAVPEVIPLLSPAALRLVAPKAIKAADNMPAIRSQYNSLIIEILTTYFENGGSVTTAKNKFRRAANDALGAAFDLGWMDGGQEMPPDEDALAWLDARIEQEFSNIAALFEQAKLLRKDPELDYFEWITARADGYTSALDGAYNAGKLFAKQNQLLEWRLGKTESHCDSCMKLSKGKPHKASWYLNRNYIPKTPGANLTCGGYNCDCKLTTESGEEVTI